MSAAPRAPAQGPTPPRVGRASPPHRGKPPPTARRSLLDVLKEHVGAEGRERMVARVMYVAQLPDRHSRAKLKDHHQRLVEGLRAEGHELTGLLLVWETCCLHMLEGTLDHLMGFLRGLRGALGDGSAPMREPRFATFMDDCEAPVFSFWDASTLNASVGDEVEAVPFQEAAEYMAEAGIQMLSLGKQLTAIPSEEKRKTGINKLASLGYDLPTPERATSLALSDDLLSLDEFLEVFGGPLHLELDSDLVWPVPRSVAI